MDSHTQAVWGLAYNPVDLTLLSASRDRSLILWGPVGAGRPLLQLPGHAGTVLGIAFSPDGRTALSASSDHTLILWDIAETLPASILRYPTRLSSMALSPDGGPALLGPGGLELESSWTLLEVDLTTGQILRRFEAGHENRVTHVQYSPDGRLALSYGDDLQLLLWDVERGTLIRRLAGYNGQLRSVQFSPDGRLIGARDVQGMALIFWDVATGNVVHRFERHTYFTDIAFSPDGQTFVSLTPGNVEFPVASTVLVLRHLDTGNLIRSYSGHADLVRDIEFSPDGRTLLSAAEDDTVILWDVATGDIIFRLEGHTSDAEEVHYSPDGQLAVSRADREIIVWDLATSRLIHRYTDQNEVSTVRFSPDGRSLYHLVSQSPETPDFGSEFGFDAIIKQWPATPAALIDFLETNRYIRPFTCDERLRYRIEPLCEGE